MLMGARLSQVDFYELIIAVLSLLPRILTTIAKETKEKVESRERTVVPAAEEEGTRKEATVRQEAQTPSGNNKEIQEELQKIL